jgi:DNA-binding transcriptional LysR family regulator
MDISKLDLRLLTTFLILMEEQNVSHAAERLGLSQPATSAILARLRDLFGDPLMVRTPQGMMPTPKAESLVPRIKEVLTDLEQLVSSPTVFHPAEAQITVSLAATDYVQAIVLPPFLKQLEQAAPRIKVAVKPIETEALKRQMERGEVDIALMPQGNAPASLSSQVLLNEQFVCVVCRNHADIRQQIDLEQYCELEHVLVSPGGNDFSGIVDRVLALHNKCRTVSVSIPNFLLVPEIVENSQRVATIPSRLAKQYQERWQILKPPLDIPGFTIALVWHSKNQHDLAQIWLRETVTQVIKDL